MYIHEQQNWTDFTWDEAAVLPLLSTVRFEQGKLLGEVSSFGFEVRQQTERDTLSDEVVASSRIEGIVLDSNKVRSSVSRHLSIPDEGAVLDSHEVDGPVEIMMDGIRQPFEPLSHQRLWAWHAALFPTGYSGLRNIHVAQYRNGTMQVVSGAIGHEKVHYEAPDAGQVAGLMDTFLTWFNEENTLEPLLKAGIAHLWFLTIHPFDDGNGRIARVITEMLLAQSDQELQRFYSLSHQLLVKRHEYYQVLEAAQKGTQDSTAWLRWFLEQLHEAITTSRKALLGVFQRTVFWSQVEHISLNQRQRATLQRLQEDFQGKLTTAKWAKLNKVSHDTALRDITDLVQKGILEQDGSGGRSTAYRLVAIPPAE